MKKILVGVDRSKGSEHVVNKAMMLVDDHGELFLLTIIPSPHEKKFVDQNLHEKLKKRATKFLQDIVNTIGRQNYKITPLVEDGEAASTIINVANALEVDLIVLGSEKTTERREYSLGNVARKVVQYAHKPVMIVR